MAIPRILVVDDDIETRKMLVQYLRQNGFIALDALNEETVRHHIENGRIDLILLDVMLGDESGIDICENLRQEQNIPIIFISALSADDHRMKGYEAGADDYIAKPFNPSLLLARVKAVLQRTQRSSSLIYRRNTTIYDFNGWNYDAKKNEVKSPKNVQVELSKRETALLKVFLANPHIPLTREEIARTLEFDKGDDAEDPNTGRAIDVLVGRLRGKIEDNPKSPKMLRTERGLGYVFAVDVEKSEP